MQKWINHGLSFYCSLYLADIIARFSVIIQPDYRTKQIFVDHIAVRQIICILWYYTSRCIVSIDVAVKPRLFWTSVAPANPGSVQPVTVFYYGISTKYPFILSDFLKFILFTSIENHEVYIC